MKIRHSKTAITFHTDWLAMAFFVAVTVWAWVSCFEVKARPAWLPNVDWWMVGTVGAGICVIATRSCRIDANGISIRYLGIPFTRIPWDRVAQLVIAPHDPENTARKELVIVLDNGPAFLPEHTALRFHQENKHSSYLITLPGKRTEKTAQLLSALIPERITLRTMAE